MGLLRYRREGSAGPSGYSDGAKLFRVSNVMQLRCLFAHPDNRHNTHLDLHVRSTRSLDIGPQIAPLLDQRGGFWSLSSSTGLWSRLGKR